MHPMDRGRAIQRFEEIPKLVLGHYPTPVEKLARLRAAVGGGPRIFIKRDDYTGPGFGGNKVRKLEYVLAAALQQGADTVITCGGERSNHCRVTAMLAARLGLGCVLVLNGRGEEPKPASLAVEQWCGARIERVASREERAGRMEALVRELKKAGKNPAMIPLGASDALGAMGFVAATAELAAQMEVEGWRFDAIYFASSSGGTHAGLAAGRELFLPGSTELVGISPDDPAEEIQSTVTSIVQGLGQRLGVEFTGEIRVLDNFVGAGYGIESPQSRRAFELLARTEGILLDPVYTAKAMAGLLDAINKGQYSESQNLLFWHTGGQLALFHV
ncbi:MAG: D-cysteine desulfhydrase family protein [Bryobacteraceae bacterium]|nr:D-cysteine desulfhydrase family protein [Bryobacteraceae bacterium]MDW8378156.1 D-cysteine desulfhydrase family protein [Bryobacterales bacterium]